MKTDPFHLPYGHLNLDEEMWREMKKMKELLKVAEEVKSIVEKGLVAVIPNDLLERLTFESTFNSEMPMSFVSWRVCSHWSGLGIAILSHCSKEQFEDVTKFQKSLFDNEPYLDENVIFADPRVPYSKNVLRSRAKESLIEVKEESPQLSLF